MIKFTAKLTVKKIEKKSVTKRDGGTFDFEEITLEHTTKKPTKLVARCMEDVRHRIHTGLTAEMDVAISSFEGKDGRVFNNFLIVEVEDVAQPTPAPQTNESAFDDIPF